ncbi:MAG: sugar ABC transporter permease [Bacilli bacterium]|nr:sugar ABC transporter permease [Bacilli bacterium]
MTDKPNLNEQNTEVEATEDLSLGSYVSGGTLQVAKPKWYMPEWLKALIALIPALFFLIIFMIYPIINTFLLSFLEDFNWVGGSGSSFAIINWAYSLSPDFRGNPAFWSFNNYVNVLADPSFINSIINTALMVVVSVPLTIVISLLIAVCLNSIKVLQGFFQTVFFLPYVTNSIALGMVFNVMFSKGGPINSAFGLDFNWLLAAAGATRWSMFLVITVYSVWNGLAFKILVFMSGLATIDKQYYDAARIDGASKVKIFARITVPLLSPQILYITITSFIGAFKAYTSVIALFGNGAYDFGGTGGKEWMTVVGYVYIMMQRAQIGRAAAASIVLLLLILAITLVQTLVSKKRVHY